jgi:hypothetical protein
MVRTSFVALASWRIERMAVARILSTSFAEDRHSFGWCSSVVVDKELPWSLVRMHGLGGLELFAPARLARCVDFSLSPWELLQSDEWYRGLRIEALLGSRRSCR